MEITGYRWGSLAEINTSLEALDSDQVKNDPSKVKTIFENILQNRTLYEQADSNETVRFIQCLYKAQIEPVNRICVEILGIAVKGIALDLEAIRKLKEIDFTLYQQSLGTFISTNDNRSIGALGLTKEEVLDAAPHITKLYINGSEEDYPDEFLGTLFQKMEKITDLGIENSSITGVSFAELKKANLVNLRFYDCGKFNFPIHDFPNLEELDLILVDDFVFDVQNMPKLTYMNLHGINNDISLDQFSELETLIITSCPEFSNPIEGFLKLQTLIVHSCGFNATIRNLPALVDLDLEGCTTFNSDIENVPKLQRFTLRVDPRDEEDTEMEFKIFERSMETVLSIVQANIHFVDEEIQKMSHEEKAKALQMCDAYLSNSIQNPHAVINPNFFRLYLRFENVKDRSVLPPKYRALYSALRYERLIELKLPSTKFLEILNKDCKYKEFKEVFIQIVQHSPKVVTFLLENAIEQFWQWMKEYCLSILELPLIVQGALLPYTSPEQIRETFFALQDDQKKELLKFQLSFMDIFDSMDPVLREVKRYNIDDASEERRRTNSEAIGELLNKIPLINLACYAHFHPQVLSAFCYAMTLEQQTVVVPLLDTSVLLDMMKKIPLENHKTYLSLATADLRAEYVARDLLVTPSVQETVARAKLLRDRHVENPSETSRRELEQFVTCTLFPLRTSLQQHEMVLKALKSIFVKDTLEGYIEAKERELSQVQTDLVSVHNELVNELSKADVTIPEGYYDALTNEIMREPLTDGTYTMDRETWQRCFMADGKHPFTRLPLNLDLLEDSDLKGELNKFHKNV